MICAPMYQAFLSIFGIFHIWRQERMEQMNMVKMLNTQGPVCSNPIMERFSKIATRMNIPNWNRSVRRLSFGIGRGDEYIMWLMIPSNL